MKYYKIIRKEGESYEDFMLRVFNEVMTFSNCHLVSVDATEYCVDFAYFDLNIWRQMNTQDKLIASR